jgi:hypothetical protein
MGADKGKARRSASSKLNVERAGKKAQTINRAILGPIGEKAAMTGLNSAKNAYRGLQSARKAEQGFRKAVNKRVRTNPTKNLSDAAQFGGKAAKNVINEAQGLAKMVMKGFGN